MVASFVPDGGASSGHAERMAFGPRRRSAARTKGKRGGGGADRLNAAPEGPRRGASLPKRIAPPARWSASSSSGVPSPPALVQHARPPSVLSSPASHVVPPTHPPQLGRLVLVVVIVVSVAAPAGLPRPGPGLFARRRRLRPVGRPPDARHQVRAQADQARHERLQGPRPGPHGRLDQGHCPLVRWRVWHPRVQRRPGQGEAARGRVRGPPAQDEAVQGRRDHHARVPRPPRHGQGAFSPPVCVSLRSRQRDRG